jgi:hypothetical protein
MYTHQSNFIIYSSIVSLTHKLSPNLKLRTKNKSLEYLYTSHFSTLDIYKKLQYTVHLAQTLLIEIDYDH